MGYAVVTSALNKRSIILFDGVCNLCESSVRFIIKRDPRGQFAFASLQSPVGERLFAESGLDAADRLDSFLLFDEDGAWQRSSAALRIAGRLSGGWPLMKAFLVVPRPIRDAVYNFIGARRYKWFGKKDVCWIPEDDVSDRFVGNMDAVG